MIHQHKSSWELVQYTTMSVPSFTYVANSPYHLRIQTKTEMSHLSNLHSISMARGRTRSSKLKMQLDSIIYTLLTSSHQDILDCKQSLDSYLSGYSCKILYCVLSSSSPVFVFLKFLFIYSWETERERERERGRDTGRGRSRLHAGSPMWDSIPGLPGSHPGPKVGTKLLSHRGVPQ